MKRLFENLRGVEVISNTSVNYIIEVSGEYIARIVEDMDLLGYITVARL